MWLFYFILYASNAKRVVTTIKMAHYILSHSLFFFWGGGGGGVTTTTTPTIIISTTTANNNNIQIQCLNIL